MFARRSWREHRDLDVGIVRRDVPALATVLATWDIHVAAAGRLRPWGGGALSDDPNDHENNLWCRPSPDSPWAIDVTVGDGDEAKWIYRRRRATRLAWSRAVRTSADGIAYLAPEVQLLYKSVSPRDQDDLDASVVIPMLDVDALAWLRAELAPEHPWRRCADESSASS